MAESSFSMMNDIIDSQSGRTEIDTYSAIMSVKYQLKLAGVTVLSKFYRKDILRDPVDGNMCYYIRTACSRYKKRLATKREVMLQRQRKLTTKKNPKIKGTKKKSKVHEKVTVKLAFYFYNFIRQSYLSFSWTERHWSTLFCLHALIIIILYDFVKNTLFFFVCDCKISVFCNETMHLFLLAELYLLCLKAVDVSIVTKNFFFYFLYLFSSTRQPSRRFICSYVYVHM